MAFQAPSSCFCADHPQNWRGTVAVRTPESPNQPRKPPTDPPEPAFRQRQATALGPDETHWKRLVAPSSWVSRSQSGCGGACYWFSRRGVVDGLAPCRHRSPPSLQLVAGCPASQLNQPVQGGRGKQGEATADKVQAGRGPLGWIIDNRNPASPGRMMMTPADPPA